MLNSGHQLIHNLQDSFERKMSRAKVVQRLERWSDQIHHQIAIIIVRPKISQIRKARRLDTLHERLIESLVDLALEWQLWLTGVLALHFDC